MTEAEYTAKRTELERQYIIAAESRDLALMVRLSAETDALDRQWEREKPRRPELEAKQ